MIACAKLSNGRTLRNHSENRRKTKGLPKNTQDRIIIRFTPIQAEDIIGLAIYRISKMDMQAIVDERVKVQKDLAFVDGIVISNVESKNHQKPCTKAQYPVNDVLIVDAEFVNGITSETPEVPDVCKHGPIWVCSHSRKIIRRRYKSWKRKGDMGILVPMVYYGICILSDTEHNNRAQVIE